MKYKSAFSIIMYIKYCLYFFCYMLHSMKLFFMLRIKNYFLNKDKIFIIHINIIYSNENEMFIDIFVIR